MKKKGKVPVVSDVDWPLLEGAMAIKPRVVALATGSVERVLLASQRIVAAETSFELGSALLEGLRTTVGLDRVALFLRSEDGRALTGLVGTRLDGKLVDERHLRHAVDSTDEALWSDLREGRRSFELREDAPWVTHTNEGTQVIGRGWFVRTPLLFRGEPLGFLYNDSAITRASFDHLRQELAATLCALVAPSLGAAVERRNAEGQRTTKFVRECLDILAREPGATNDELARRLGISAPRLSREFQSAMKTSLIDYRIEKRLERFFELVEEERRNERQPSFLDLALEAGFGSYSQFHRIFSRKFGHSPRRQFGS